MKTWILPSLSALILWGVWGFLPKIATKHIDPKSALVFQAIGSVIVGLGVWVAFKDQIQWQTTGAFWAIATGVFGMLGSLFFFTGCQSREGDCDCNHDRSVSFNQHIARAGNSEGAVRRQTGAGGLVRPGGFSFIFNLR